MALVGPAGSGKTLLLRLLAGLLSPSQGTIACQGKRLGPAQGKAGDTTLSPTDWRRSIAYVPAQPRLLGGIVREAIVLPLQLQGLAVSEIQTRLDRVAAQCRVPGTLWDKAERELSLADCRRVAIARALIAEPLLLLVDEAEGPEPLPGALLAALRAEVGGLSWVVASSRVPGWEGIDRYGWLRQGTLVEGPIEQFGPLLGEPLGHTPGHGQPPASLADDWG